MGVTEKILNHMLTIDYFRDSGSSKISGIATLAVAKGFDALSPAQQDVLRPYLSDTCSGYKDPADQVSCHAELEGESLLNALLEADSSESLQCESCRSESAYYERRWQQMLDE